jgi:hypothetical protein
MTDGPGEYRAHALAAETKAFNARTEETRRAWLMADRWERALMDRLANWTPTR